MNNGLIEAYRKACREHEQAWNYFQMAEPHQVYEAISWLSLTEQRVARLKRELEKEMGQSA